MLFVGIDIAKNKHDMAVIDSEGNVVLKHLTFKNDRPGFDKMHAKIMELIHDYETDIAFALEDTGHYGLNLQTFLRKYYLNIYTYNPLLIKKFSEAQTLRKTKTDKRDTLLIARKLLIDFAELNEPIAINPIMAELKFATRNRSRLTQVRSDAKTQYTRILDIMFPELTSITSKHNQSTLTLLKNFPSVELIANAQVSSLAKIKYLSADTALKIKEAALTSIGTSSVSLELELRLIIENIAHMDQQIQIVDHHIEALMVEINSPIVSVTGIGDRLGAVILAEIRDINNFSNPAQLQSFAGLDPSVYQSGESVLTGRMVKRGSPHLRWAILQAAKLATNYSPKLNEYLQKKLAEGKHYNCAITHVAKKLMRIIFYLLKNNQPFDEQLVG